jgi:hypothetical protein
MAHHITGIDHVLLAVRDLAHANEVFSRLGFTTSPRGGHAEWGTANHCIMFPGDYIELLAAAGDGPGAQRVDAHVNGQGEGLMGIALGSRDAALSSASLREAGVAAAPPASLSRSLMAPDGEVTPRFNTVDLPKETLPGLPAFLCQHLTPGLLRRPEWMSHPNGASSIVSLTVLIERPETKMGHYNRLLGPAASTPTDEMVTVHSGRGLIFLVTPEGFDDLHPNIEITLPPPPAVVVLTLGVADLGQTLAVLKAKGVGADLRGGQLTVDPADALGIGLEFVER